MENLLSKDHPVVQEYSRFMEWLKENHPEIYNSKYRNNFQIPFQIGGGVVVNQGWKISNEEHEMLFKIAESYYHPHKK